MPRSLPVHKPHGISASSVGRALECAWWAREEHVWQAAVEDGSLAARGHEGHAAVEALLKGEDPETKNQALIDSAHRAVEWVRSEGLLVLGVEQVLFYDAFDGTARFAQARDHRAYVWEKSHEIPGTADFFGAYPQIVHRTAVVADWKFRAPGVHTKGSASYYETQLRTLALGWRVAKKADDVRAFVVKLTPKAAMPEAIDVTTDVLRDHHRKLRALMHGLKKSEPRAGDHCKFCRFAREPKKGESGCPAYVARQETNQAVEDLFD